MRNLAVCVFLVVMVVVCSLVLHAVHMEGPAVKTPDKALIKGR